jgi:YesN/AraC family two-component response regulator
METKWLHNPEKNDTTLFYKKKNGITVEHMVRSSDFDMRYNHFHQEYEIYLLLGGRRQIFFDNRAYIAEAGNLVLVDSGQIHMSHSVSNDLYKQYERIILYIDQDKVKQYDVMFPELKMGRFLHKHFGIYALSPEQLGRIVRMYQNLMKEMKDQNAKSQTMMDLEIIDAFISFWRENKPVSYIEDDKNGGTNTGKNGKYTTVYAVSDYVSEHFCEDISLDDLSNRFFISKYYLSRSFREVTGVGIREYVNTLRVQKAQNLLSDTNMSVSEISERLGFESITYFERIFKRFQSISPVQFRKQLQKK